MEGDGRRGGTRVRRYESRRKESAQIYREIGWKGGERIDWEFCHSQDAMTDVEMFSEHGQRCVAEIKVILYNRCICH